MLFEETKVILYNIINLSLHDLIINSYLKYVSYILEVIEKELDDNTGDVLDEPFC
jgi:hypothetical protein